MSAAPVRLFATIAIGFIFSSAVMAQVYVEPMTNRTIEQMVQHGRPVNEVIQAIRTAPEVDFLVDNYEIHALSNAGASDRNCDQILVAMKLRVARGPVTAEALAAELPPLPPPSARAFTTSGLNPGSGSTGQCAGTVEAFGLAHTRQLIESLPEQMYRSVVDGFEATPATKLQKGRLYPLMKRIFSAAFEPNSFYNDMASAFASRCDPQSLSGFVSLARSSPFGTLDRDELAALRPTFRSDVQAFVASPKNRPSGTRVALLRRLDSAMGSTEFAGRMAESAVRIVYGANGSTPGVEEIGTARKLAAEQLAASNFYVYRKVSDQDLARYIQFLEQPSCRWFNHLFAGIIGDLIEGRTAVAFRQIITEFRSSKTATSI